MTNPSLRVVDEAETGLGQPLPLRLSQIERFDGQPRRYFDDKSIEELAKNILEYGHKTPVKVCKHPEKKSTFILIGGERRWRAFHLIREWKKEEPIVKAFIDASPRSFNEHFIEAVIDNVQREDLIPLDEAAAYHQMHIEAGLSKADISRLSGKSYSHVDNYIRLHSLPDAVKRWLDPNLPKEQRLSVTAAIDIARSIADADLQIQVAKEAIERSLGLAETRSLISIRTGKRGFGIGGRLRKPSDDYKLLATFLGRTQTHVRRLHENLNIDDLYCSRDDEINDRKRDARSIKNIISYFEALLRDIEKTPQ